MKKLVAILLILALPLMAYFVFTQLEETVIILAVNNVPVEADNPVVFDTVAEQEVLYVPAIMVSELLGFKVELHDNKNTLTTTLGKHISSINIGSRVAVIEGEHKLLDAPAKYFHETVYMPASYVEKALYAMVEWDDAKARVTIETPRSFNPPIDEEQDGPLLYVAYPPGNGISSYYGESLFVFGTTDSFSLVDVRVNGNPVDIIDIRSGNFLTMVDITRGTETLITIEATSDKGITRLERSVIYPVWWKKMPVEPLAFHPSRLVPSDNLIVQAGDTINIAFQGTPGCKASFQIGNKSSRISMTERAYPGGPSGKGGIYTATYRVSQNDLPSNGVTDYSPLTVFLSQGDKEINMILPGKIAFLADSIYKTIEVKEEKELKNKGWLYSVQDNRLQLLSTTTGGSGYPTSVISYLQAGTRFNTVGAFGDYYRVLVGNNRNHLIHRDVVIELEENILDNPVLSAITAREDTDKVQIIISASERFPFFITDGKSYLNLRMHDMKAEGTSPEITSLPASVNNLELKINRDRDTSPAEMLVETNFDMVGFKTYWEGNNLLVELYKPYKSDIDNPLKDKVIIIDPGHGGNDKGAVGPGGVDEKDAVLSISSYLHDILIDKGAQAVMTRTEDIDVNLYDRPEEIDLYDPDLFISIHANAHAHNAPATKIHGIMTLYNYAHNEILADIMLDTMVKESPLPRFRTWRRNIAVIRHPHVPSVLVEVGYLMHPYDNWYILHPREQEMVANAMAKGILNYFQEINRQAENP